jgi:hypothetical protein
MIEVLAAILFFSLIMLYLFARLGGMFERPPEDHPTERTSSEKLFYSKVYDAAFFDGESEDYAEVMMRLRTYGGA